MLLADGQMVYFGERGERAGMVDYLANQGFKCHPIPILLIIYVRIILLKSKDLYFNFYYYLIYIYMYILKVELLNDNENKKKLINAYVYWVREDPTGKKVIVVLLGFCDTVKIVE